MKDRILSKLSLKDTYKKTKSLSSEEESENKLTERKELKDYHNQCDN